MGAEVRVSSESGHSRYIQVHHAREVGRQQLAHELVLAREVAPAIRQLRNILHWYRDRRGEAVLISLATRVSHRRVANEYHNVMSSRCNAVISADIARM